MLHSKIGKYFDIRRVSLDFIKTYYESRSQHVFFDAVKSSIPSQELGVIQGSYTGPLFLDI